MKRVNPMKPLSVTIQVAIQGAQVFPALSMHLIDTKEDVCNSSRAIVVDNNRRTFTLRAPRGTPFGQMAKDDSPLVKMLFYGYKNGTYTISGTYRWLEDADSNPRLFSLNLHGRLSVLAAGSPPVSEDSPDEETNPTIQTASKPLEQARWLSDESVECLGVEVTEGSTL